MPLTLAPETEARLRSLAAQRGAFTAEADFNGAVAGIRAHIYDFAAGHWTSLEDYQGSRRRSRPITRWRPSRVAADEAVAVGRRGRVRACRR